MLFQLNRRVFPSFGLLNNGNNDSDDDNSTSSNTSFTGRNYFRLSNMFGYKLSWFLYSALLFLFFFMAVISEMSEYKMNMDNQPQHSPTIRSTKSKSQIFDIQLELSNTSIMTNGSTILNNTTIPIATRSNPAGSTHISFVSSLLISLFSWLALIQVLRFIRNSSLPEATRSRRNETQLLAQLSLLNNGNLPRGLSNRLRLAMMQRDFTGDDYEMLQQLDEFRGSQSPGHHGASESEINRLPLHVITTADIEADPYNSCNICLAPYEINEEIRTIVCMHKFHKHCIDTWLRTNATCPVCKFSAVVH
eukprot:gene7519-10242_t